LREPVSPCPALSAALLAQVRVSPCDPQYFRSTQEGPAVRHETRPVTVRTRWLMIGEGGRKDLLSAALMSGPLVLQKLIEGLADDFVTFARSGL